VKRVANLDYRLVNCLFFFLFSTSVGCQTEVGELPLIDELVDSVGVESPVYSCLYHNKHAGMDCKEFIGEAFADAAFRQEHCGVNFFEEDAIIVEETCPLELEIDGVLKPAKGVCYANKGQADEYALFSYEADLSIMETACTTFVEGEWVPLVEDDGEQEIYELLPGALEALDSTEKVAVSSSCKELICLEQMVENGETFDFVPVGREPVAGLVLYPGGNVDPRAYAPAAHALAEQGILVSIVPMENYLALAGYLSADDVRAAYPQIESWYVGGHSLGGAMAARYGAIRGASAIDGVIIWASIADHEDDLSGSGLNVITIYGSLDGGLSPAEVMEYSSLLPEDAVFVCLSGGDHSQFGYYEDDHPPAEISREEQQKQVTRITGKFIQNPASVQSVACKAAP